MHKLKIVIIGAGMGGLTAAIALHQAGCEVEICDRVPEMRPVGAGISLWSNGVKVLNHLGLSRQIAAIGGNMDIMQYRTRTGELLNDIDLMPLVTQVGQRPYPVARTDLQAMLLQAYPGQVRLNSHCIGIESHQRDVTAIFADGYRTTGDVLIAADGIRSILRTHVLGQEVKPQYRDYVNWNGLVNWSADLAPKNTWVIYVGEHKRASLMPVGGDRFYFFFDVPLPQATPADPNGMRAELKAHFQGWADPLQALVERLDENATNRLQIHDVGPIASLVRGRVALLGDAAHATCPDLGQGGCQAMEDAFVLTRCLQMHPDVESALRQYECDRMARVTAIVQKARHRSETIHGKDPEVTQQWYQQLAQERPEDVTNAIAKIILAGPLQ